MKSCNKNGECLIQCECECYNENTNIYYKKCICGHREHNGYCPSNCCLLVKCKNFDICKQLRPKWVLDANFNMCINCAVISYSKNKLSK